MNLSLYPPQLINKQIFYIATIVSTNYNCNKSYNNNEFNHVPEDALQNSPNRSEQSTIQF